MLSELESLWANIELKEILILRSEWAQELTNTEKTATNYLAEALEEDKSKGEVISI